MRDLRTIDVVAPAVPADRKPDAPTSDAPKPAGAPHGWILVGAPLLGYVLAIAVMVVVIFAVAFAAVATPSFAPRMDQLAQSWRAGRNIYPIYMGATALLYATIFVVMWMLLPKSGPASLGSYFRRVSRTTLGFAVFTGLLLAFALVVTQSEIVTHHLVTFHQTRGEQAIVPATLRDIAPGLLAIALIGPIVEEVYFRGLLLRWLGSKMNVVFAVLVSALVFAAMHAKFVSHNEIEGLILTGELAVVGLITAIWALATRSLWPSFAVHGSYNAAIIMLPLLVNWMKPG